MSYCQFVEVTENTTDQYVEVKTEKLSPKREIEEVEQDIEDYNTDIEMRRISKEHDYDVKFVRNYIKVEEEEELQINPVEQHICNASYDGLGSHEVHVNTEHGGSSEKTISNKSDKHWETDTTDSTGKHGPKKDKNTVDQKLLKCPICYSRFEKKGNLMNHMLSHNAGCNLLKCENCEYSTVRKNHMARHMKFHDKCDGHCENMSFGNSDSDTCCKIHNVERPYKCGRCAYRGRQKSELKKHMGIHDWEKPNKCDKCDYSCIQRDKYILHIRTHIGEKPFKCKYCDFRCASNNYLLKHQRIHLEEKPFKCNHCEYCCRQKDCLLNHLKAHGGVMPFKCDECDFACRFKQNFMQHMAIHYGDLPLKCDHCEYRCVVKAHLVEHVKTHSGELPIKFDYCECSKYLCTPKKTYSGEGLFKCEYCGYRCKQKGTYSAHMRTHNDEKPILQ